MGIDVALAGLVILCALMVLSFFLIQSMCKTILPDIGNALINAFKGLVQDDEKNTKEDISREAEFHISSELDKKNLNWYDIINNSQNDIDSIMANSVTPLNRKGPNIIVTPRTKENGLEGLIPGPTIVTGPDFGEHRLVLVPDSIGKTAIPAFPRIESKSMGDMILTSEGRSKSVNIPKSVEFKKNNDGSIDIIEILIDHKY